MIQIIAGTFGYYNGRKVVPITNQDGPKQFDPELEARLVKEGVQVRRRSTRSGRGSQHARPGRRQCAAGSRPARGRHRAPCGRPA